MTNYCVSNKSLGTFVIVCNSVIIFHFLDRFFVVVTVAAAVFICAEIGVVSADVCVAADLVVVVCDVDLFASS